MRGHCCSCNFLIAQPVAKALRERERTLLGLCALASGLSDDEESGVRNVFDIGSGVQAVAKALREREQALLTVHALESELRQKRRGISSLEESGQQVRLSWLLHTDRSSFSRLCCPPLSHNGARRTYAECFS